MFMKKIYHNNGIIELIRLIAVLLITFTHVKHSYKEGLVYIILEEIPRYGTLILSIISGYLYGTITRHNSNIFFKKVQSLLFPYLLANAIVLSVVYTLHLFGYDFLNRLSYNLDLVKEGLFAFNSPPVNPPTYFVRDLFVIFTFLSLFHKEKWALILLPLAIYGTIILRYDVLICFSLGLLYSLDIIKRQDKFVIILFVFLATSGLLLFKQQYYLKHLACFITFVLLVDLKFTFIKTGGYTYFLHLYHSPIIVFIHPILSYCHLNDGLKVILQIIIPIIISFLAYRLLKAREILFVTGQR